MKPSLQVLDLPVDRIETTLIVVPFFTDQRPLDGPVALLDWRLDGYLTTQLVQDATRGASGERYLVKANHKIAAEWVMFVGCGQRPGGDEASVAALVDELLTSVSQAGFRQVAFGLPVESTERMTYWQAALEQALPQHAAPGMECRLAACDPAAYRD